MSNPVGTFQTYQAIGNREDLSDMIFNISPTETPFQSMAKRTKATNQKHEWQKDSLRTASSANQQVEGDTPSNTTVVPTVRLFNASQISSYAFNISGTQQAVNPAGRADELAYQLVKFGKELKRDMEAALTANTAYAAGSSGTARVTGGLEAWIATNATSQGSGGSPAYPGFSSTGVVASTDNSLQGTVSEANVKSVIRGAWTQGGNPDTIMVGPFNKTRLSTFAGLVGMTNNIFQKAGGQATLIAAVDAYQSDFGALKIIPNRFQRDRTVLVLDFEFWAVAYLRPFQSFPLAKVGDSDQRMILAEYALESRQEAASGKVADCTTS
jgi:hypothetical protein